MILANVTKGKRRRPPRVLVYGPEKIGKSTFASGAPNPVFFGKDEGTDELDVTRLPQPRSFGDMMNGLALVRSEAKAQGWETLVVDPVNWLEVLIQRAVAQETGEEFSAFDHSTPAFAKWRMFLERLESVWDAGIGIVLVAHSAVKKVELPDVPAYERFEPAMSPRIAGMLLQWVDAIMFARQETLVRTGKKHEKTKAVTSGYRLLETEMQPAFIAGNRCGLPPQIPLSWDAFDKARLAGSADRNLDEIRAIAAELEGLGDAGLVAQVESYLESKASRVEILNKLRARRERALAAQEPVAEEKPEGGEPTSDTEPTDTNEPTTEGEQS